MAQRKTSGSKKTTGTSKKSASAKSTAKPRRRDTKAQAAKKKSFIQSEVFLILIMAAGCFLVLSAAGFMGAAGDAVRAVLQGLFGQGSLLFGIVLIAFAALSYHERGSSIRVLKLISLVCIYVVILSFMHLMFAEKGDDGIIYMTAAELYGASALGAAGGGVAGGLPALFLKGVFGTLGAFLVLIVLFLIGLVIITEKSLVQFAGRGAAKTADAVKHGAKSAYEAAGRKMEDKAARQEEKKKAAGSVQTETGRRRSGGLSGVKLPENSGEESGTQNMETGGAAAEGEYNSAVKEGIPDIDIIDYTVDTVPFEETPDERYKSYAGITGRSVIDLGYCMEEGYAAGNIPSSSKTPKEESGRVPGGFNGGTEGINISGLRENGSKEAGGEGLNLEELSINPAEAAEDGSLPFETVDGNGGENVIPFPKPFVDHEAPGEENEEDVKAEAKRKSRKPHEKRTEPETPEEAPKPVPEGGASIISEKKPKPYVFPDASLLERGKRGGGDSGAEARTNARKLEQVLRNFGVGVRVTNVTIGPRVSRYEMIPDTGVKVSRITALSGDIKLALAAAEMRIEAPIPGKSAVGIEIPNSDSRIVRFRDILESDEFKNARSKLTWGLGMDIQGKPVVCDIAKMPHMLVAGTTGSGKSVGINSLIMSVLYKSTPEEVRMILIDPKVVELSVYNGIPHLLTEVVTKPDRALTALNWAVAEMNNRYRLFQQSATRNIAGYNSKAEDVNKSLGEDADEDKKVKKLPYILIVIDELSELMMHSKKDVESAIVSLTQLARAAGIHLVVATQRPSVDVITGLIKSNIPSRIAYRLPSATDSRTILDSGGAENLLGNGDMLFKPGDKNAPDRIQGAFLTDAEVEGVVDFVRKQNGEAPDAGSFDEACSTQMELDFGTALNPDAAGRPDRDEYFADAGRLIITSKKASIGALQRKFKIGFNRAARIMDQLFEAGVVSGSEGTKERQVLMDINEFEDMLGQ